MTGSFDLPQIEPGQVPCSQCGEREAVPAGNFSLAGQRGWCGWCDRRYFDEMTADFPGNRRYWSPEPPGEYIARPILKAAQKRAKAEVLLWFKAWQTLTFTWRVFKGEEWEAGSKKKRWTGAHALALIGILNVDAALFPALRLPTVYISSPAMKDRQHTVLRWFLWHPGQNGYLEMAWNPDEGLSFSLHGLRMKTLDATGLPDAKSRKQYLRDRQRLLDLAYVPSTAGRPPGSGVAYPDALSYLTALATFTDKAKAQGWNLKNSSYCSADWIGGKLTPAISGSQLFEENSRAGIGMDDIRKSRITWSFVESWRASN